MIKIAQRFSTSYKALRQLGPGALFQYAQYRLALETGALMRATPPWTGSREAENSFRFPSNCLLELPDPHRLHNLLGQENYRHLLEEANEIISGRIRLFGGKAVRLRLSPPGPLLHWTLYERGQQPWGSPDVKLIWEPARFGWAFTLGRAYYLSKDERYADFFWKQTEKFLATNPTNMGPNWASAQEVALRLIAFTFALCVFRNSPHTHPERTRRLGWAIAVHASRIPVSLAYARSQHNNHLLTEAAALYTAGLALPEHPQAPLWQKLGQRWLNIGLQEQIDEDGNYSQHSTNYHRLMLQIALWGHSLRLKETSELYELKTKRKLAAATRWLSLLLDPYSGRVPNLGPNDGAYIFPLTVCPFNDFRPVVQAAAQAFLSEQPLLKGVWDEMAMWFRCPEFGEKGVLKGTNKPKATTKPLSPHVLRSPSGESWAYLRVAHFRSRPGHADQLHLDLWWRALNIAQDPGTYFYNAPPPWENALAHTAFHNTVSVDGKDQMERAGRFLWLDWAQGTLTYLERDPEGSLNRLAAMHNGYKRRGVFHRREVTVGEEVWLVQDKLLSGRFTKVTSHKEIRNARLHWLLPDWEWKLEEDQNLGIFRILVLSPYGWITIEVTAENLSTSLSASLPEVTLVRAGKLLHGQGPATPQSGWISPTYAIKVPALSFSISYRSPLPINFSTRFIFPEQE